ncbi:hypothetical protein LCGC14_2521810 [marine sediment metagenome]|uniref:Uncharacterized protein n=1 Tax=marine sediment metagenome TaxID=412755 RepID=A0A0F9BJ50_9ZZZZ
MGSKIDLVLEEVSKIRISQARTEEHLKSLNGNIQRHETLIEANRKNITKARIGMAKLIGLGGVGGVGAALIILLITKTFGLG